MSNFLDKTALALVIIGALNWGSVGLFAFDAVAWLFGGQTSLLARAVYILVAASGIWCLTLLFKPESGYSEKRYHGYQ